MNNRDYPNSGILFRNDRKCGDRALLKGTADITCPHGNQRANLRVIRGRKEGVALPRPSHQIASGKSVTGHHNQLRWITI